MKKYVKKKDLCNIIMPSEETRVLGFNKYKKPDKAPSIIYADLECILEKIDGCKNNPENQSAANVSQHIPSMSTISSFGSIGNNHDVDKGRDCMKTFSESLRKHTKKILVLKRKK